MRVRITATKYNGKPHIAWDAQLLKATRDQIVCYAPFGTVVTHHTRQTEYTADYASVFVYPVGAWYNVALGFYPDGTTRHVYCNVAMPVQRTNSGLHYVDLDLDVLQFAGEPVRLDDEDEFFAHRVSMAYPDDVVVQARRAADRLLDQAAKSVSPFGIRSLTEALAAYGCSGVPLH